MSQHEVRKHPPHETPAGAKSSVAAYIDSVESGIARLLLQGLDGEWRGYSLPATILPPGAGEGSWLELTFKTREPPQGTDSTLPQPRIHSHDDGSDIEL